MENTKRPPTNLLGVKLYFRGFLLGGFKNVTIEFLLIALAFHIEKLHNKIKKRLLQNTFYHSATTLLFWQGQQESNS